MPRSLNEDLAKLIGTRMQTARRGMGLTQAALAELIHVEPVTVSRYETGARMASVTTLARAAEVLHVRLGDLVDAAHALPERHHKPEVEKAIRVLEAMTPDKLNLALRVLANIAE